MKYKVCMLVMAGMLLFAGCGFNSGQVADENPVQDIAVDEKQEQDQGDVADQNEEPESEQALQEENAEDSEKEEGQTSSVSFAEVSDLEFYFSSGAGGWGTELYIHEDGSFDGKYHDSDMGDMGEGYPDGTLHLSQFEGHFTQPEQVDEYTCKFQIKDITYANPLETEEIVDGVRQIYTDAYGLDGAEDFYLYRPETPIDKLSDEFLMWVGIYNREEADRETLDCYGLCNVAQEYGFSSYKMPSAYELATDRLKQVQDDAQILTDQLTKDDLTQTEMNQTARDIYDEWDAALNYIWGLIQDNLPEEEYNKVLEEQREWVLEKEQQVAEAGAEYEGGSMQPLVEHNKAALLTQQRAFELAEYLK